ESHYTPSWPIPQVTATLTEPLFPYTPLFRSGGRGRPLPPGRHRGARGHPARVREHGRRRPSRGEREHERAVRGHAAGERGRAPRSEEHTSELQSLRHLVCSLLHEKQKALKCV